MVATGPQISLSSGSCHSLALQNLFKVELSRGLMAIALASLLVDEQFEWLGRGKRTGSGHLGNAKGALVVFGAHLELCRGGR